MSHKSLKTFTWSLEQDFSKHWDKKMVTNKTSNNLQVCLKVFPLFIEITMMSIKSLTSNLLSGTFSEWSNQTAMP